MTDRVFLDTNVLVYADDLDAGDKRVVAQRVLDESIRSRTAVLSTQVLQAFFVVSTRKMGVPADVARRKLELLANLEVVQVDRGLIFEAVDLSRLNQLSFWDALILSCARAGGCAKVLTEDLQHGRVVGGVRVENPFHAG